MEFFTVTVWNNDKQRHVEVARFKTRKEAEAKAKEIKGSRIGQVWKPGFAPF